MQPLPITSRVGHAGPPARANQADPWTQAARCRGGFTLVEILVVVIIIAVLAALIVPSYVGRVGQAKQSVAKQKLSILEQAVQMFRLDYSRYPETLDELIERPGDIPAEKWHTPSVKAKDLLDPWDNRFVYKCPGDHGPFDVSSLGADGQQGGEGENADVVNW
jgi:general secretion pathway protein G